ncbi:protoporphyrinogen oxidase [Cohnella faecalis]
MKRVAVVGGGLTGLSAAFYLRRLAEEQGKSVDVTVLEGSARLGGIVNTLRKDGFVIERGPDSFLARKVAMYRLAEELGLERELTGTNPAARKTYMAGSGKLHPMPAGLNLGIPADLGGLARTGLLSPEGKQRALAELRLPVDPIDDDVSVGEFLESRFGREMVERLCEPLLAGIHAGDLYALGLKATFPQFADLAAKHGSLMRGMMAARLAPAAAGVTGAGIGLPDFVPKTAFLTFRRGLSSLIEALEARLRADEGCRVRTDSKVVSLAGSEGAYVLRMGDGSTVEADDVLFTLPAYATAALLESHADVMALKAIRYVSVANVVLAYDAADFHHRLDGSGFLVPKTEGRHITASTWTSAKWLHTAPEGKRLVRCYVGRAGDEAKVELSDEEMTAAVRNDLRHYMGIDATPEFVEISRLRHAMPQYPVGHVQAIAAFREGLSRDLPGVWATGAAFGGVGLPDCVSQGRDAAARILAGL